jgi:hypothetical protein
MGKSKKQKRNSDISESDARLGSPALIDTAAAEVSQKEKKKIQKKFGVNLLQHANEKGWEGHELVNICILLLLS